MSVRLSDIFNPYISVFLAFVGGGTLAYIDEYRQSFVAGRVGSLVDVFIDMVGVTLAVFLILFSIFITSGGRRKYFHREKPEKKINKGETFMSI